MDRIVGRMRWITLPTISGDQFDDARLQQRRRHGIWSDVSTRKVNQVFDVIDADCFALGANLQVGSWKSKFLRKGSDGVRANLTSTCPKIKAVSKSMTKKRNQRQLPQTVIEAPTKPHKPKDVGIASWRLSSQTTLVRCTSYTVNSEMRLWNTHNCTKLRDTTSDWFHVKQNVSTSAYLQEHRIIIYFHLKIKLK